MELNKNSIAPLVIYHDNCIDGFGAAWVFHHFGKITGVDFEFFAAKYGQPIPAVAQREVFFVDFCLSLEQMQSILAMADKLTLIDHHPLALEVDAAFEKTGYDVKYDSLVSKDHSGAVLAWRYWQGLAEAYPAVSAKLGKIEEFPAMPSLLAHIEDRDLWKFKLHETKEICAALYAMPMDFSRWDDLMAYDERELSSLASMGHLLLAKQNRDVRALIKQCYRLIVIRDDMGNSFGVPCVGAPWWMASDVGQALSAMYANGDLFAATYYDTEEGRVFSLRSQKNGMDVNRIAKCYDGGGHPNAAGFTVPRSHPLAKA